MDTYRGHVGSVAFSSDDFFIFGFQTFGGQYRKMTCKGTLFGVHSLSSGIALELSGRWTKHPKFGTQFEVQGWTPLATSEGDVEAFLTTCLGVSLIRAGNIVDVFGTDTFAVLTNEPNRLLEVEDIDEAAKAVLAEAWTFVLVSSQMSTFFGDHEVSSHHFREVMKKFGVDSKRILTENPYRLMEVDGFPFNKADDVARDLGIECDDPRRYEGAVLWVLREAMSSGHLCVRRGSVVTALRDLLNKFDVDPFDEGTLSENVMSAIERLNQSRGVKVDPEVGVYLPTSYWNERESSRLLARFVGEAGIDADVGQFLEEYQKLHQIELSDEQRDALHKLRKHKVLVITGLPGTGKTTALRTVVDLLEQVGITFSLMAPTGIASKRLSASTGKMASTIHRAFGFNGMQWTYHRFNKYPIGAVVVDEMSMVDQELFFRILDALNDDTILVLVGDDAQLPSVGPGNVLRELIKCPDIPTVRLETIFRQALESAIITNSHNIHKGAAIEPGTEKSDFRFIYIPDEGRVADLIVQMSVKLKSKDANFQVLSPKYDGVLGVNNLNDLLREALNPADATKREVAMDGFKYREGDRVMIIKNDYNAGVYNGDMGKLMAVLRDHVIIRIHGVGEGGLDMQVEIPRKELISKVRLAYVVTIHRCQGNEFDTVILPICRGHGRMLQRNLLYTAVTRAKKQVWMLGEKSAVSRAIANNEVVNRGTAFARSVSAAILAGVEAGDIRGDNESRVSGEGLHGDRATAS